MALVLVFAATATTALASSDDGVAHFYWSGWFSTVRQGNSNIFVYPAQRVLQQYYDSSQGYTGYFGSQTYSNVRGFQTLKGASVDGIVGPETWSYLQAELRDSDGDHMHTVYSGDGNEYFWHGQATGTWYISHDGDNVWVTVK